jgi:hypothetical protein
MAVEAQVPKGPFSAGINSSRLDQDGRMRRVLSRFKAYTPPSPATPNLPYPLRRYLPARMHALFRACGRKPEVI